MARAVPFAEAPTLIPPGLRGWLGARLQGPPRGPRTRQREVCGIALGRIGDFVLVLPSFRLLVHEFGAAQCALVVPRSVVPLAQVELPGVELITLPGEAPGLLRHIVPAWRLSRTKFATDRFARRVMYVHLRSFYQDLASTWVDAAADFRLAPAAYPFGPAGELQAHRTVTSAALGREVSLTEVLPRFEHFPSGNDGRLLVYPISRDEARSLPLMQVGHILRLWRDRCAAPIVFGGDPQDAPMLEVYAATARSTGVSDVTVETPAGVVAFVQHLAQAGAVLSADSASAHIAGAFDKPTVTLVRAEWHGISQPWQRSERQQAFSYENAPPEEVAAALPVLS